MKKLKVLELYAGTRSIGKAFERKGHEVFSIDFDKQHKNIDWYVDINTISAEDILERFGKPDVIWASPDCRTYSIAGIRFHRRKLEDGTFTHVSEDAKIADEGMLNLLKMIEKLEPKYWFIENPRATLRKMSFMEELPRYTITYCQYGDDRMKPTDIWTNHPNPDFKPMCKNGDPCHTSAPRGSQTGTQGRKGSVERSVIPDDLCDYIVEITSED